MKLNIILLSSSMCPICKLYNFFSVCMEPVQPMGGYIDQGTVVHPHLYLPVPTRNTLYKVSAASSPHTLLASVLEIFFISQIFFFLFVECAKSLLKTNE